MTAELVAILMALNHVNGMGRREPKIVVFSDSMSALQCISNDHHNAREDVVREIQAVTHQLIIQGTDVTFHWVPAHIGVTGNELADRAAKEAAEGGELSVRVPLELGLYADIRAKLTEAAWKEWSSYFTKWAEKHDVMDPSPPTKKGIYFSEVSSDKERIMHRIRFNHWRSMFSVTRCPCGDVVSFNHAIFKCVDNAEERRELLEQLEEHDLTPTLKSVVCCHETTGWLLLVLAAELVYDCKAAAYL